MEDTDQENSKLPSVFEKELSVYEKPLKYVRSPPYDLLATNKRFMISKRTDRKQIGLLPYKDISSIEHKRLMSFKRLGAALAFIALALLILFAPFSEKLAKDSLNWVKYTMKFSINIKPYDAVLIGFCFFSALAALTLFVFSASLRYRLVIYYSGKGSLSVPLQLDRDALELMSVMHEHIKKSSSFTKEEIEQIIGDKVGKLIYARAELERKLLETIKAAAADARTPEDKLRVKAMFETSVTRLEEQDMAIEAELKGTGITKEEVFKKYRIKPPKEEFIDAVLQDNDLAGLFGSK